MASSGMPKDMQHAVYVFWFVLSLSMGLIMAHVVAGEQLSASDFVNNVIAYSILLGIAPVVTLAFVLAVSIWRGGMGTVSKHKWSYRVLAFASEESVREHVNLCDVFPLTVVAVVVSIGVGILVTFGEVMVVLFGQTLVLDASEEQRSRDIGWLPSIWGHRLWPITLIGIGFIGTWLVSNAQPLLLHVHGAMSAFSATALQSYLHTGAKYAAATGVTLLVLAVLALIGLHAYRFFHSSTWQETARSIKAVCAAFKDRMCLIQKVID
jgi:hypothetical protein